LRCLLALTLVGGLCNGPRCAAQAVEPRAALEDAKLYFTAPLRWEQDEWLRFGGTLVVLGVAYNYDENVRGHFIDGPDDGLDGSDSNSTSDALPAAVLVAGTWMYAAFVDDPAGYAEVGSMLEAGVLSAASTEILKLSLGRERPDETADASNWFNGGDSFPSLHSSAAFSIGTVFAESGNDDYRWLRRVVGYGVAGYTAYSRVSDNAHWMSDVMAGGALGYYTARFVMHRRTSDGTESTEPSVMLLPMDQGLMLTFSMATK
jgi:membrane-associated phospholipid phosphatase